MMTVGPPELEGTNAPAGTRSTSSGPEIVFWPTVPKAAQVVAVPPEGKS